MAAWLVSGNSGAYGKAEDLVAPTYVAAADTASPGCLPNGTCALALTITNTNSALKIVSVDGTVTPVFTTSDNAACPSSRSRGRTSPWQRCAAAVERPWEWWAWTHDLA